MAADLGFIRPFGEDTGEFLMGLPFASISYRWQCRCAAPIESTLAVERREELAQVRDLRRVVDEDVRVVRVPAGIVLVVGLGGIERGQRRDLGDDAAAERLGPRAGRCTRR